MSCIVITDHAMSRYKERTSISKSRIIKDAEQAWNNGVSFEEASGSLRRYIDSQHFGSKMSGLVRIWNGRVYVFKNDTLITIFDLPEKYKRKGIEYRIRKKRNKDYQGG